MKKIYAILAISSLTANGQTTYFEQNFSSGGTPASYVSSTPNTGQVNGLAGLSATITNNAAQFTRPTDSGTGYISRSADFAGLPTSLHVQFSFEVLSNDPGITGTSAVIFYVGSGFSAGPQNPDVGETYARLALNLSETTSGQFQVRSLPSGGGGNNSVSFSGRQTITFAMNNTGSNNFGYISPTGSLEPLPNDTYDIWVGATKVFDNEPVLTPSQTISDFKFRINNGVGVVQIGDMLMRDISGALPVTLLSFTAKPNGDRVQLAWVTTSELDADRFVVERSHDASEYVTVGEVAAKGTTNGRQYYGLTDMNPKPGINNYRLKQIDLNGTGHTYKPVSVFISASEPVVAVFPNPASPDRIHLRLWNADDASVRLLTTTGQPINGRLERQPGEANLVFGQPLSAGLYFLEVTINGQKRTMNVVIR